jgi:hypothetical protein
LGENTRRATSIPASSESQTKRGSSISSTPKRTVTLLPSPRARGTSPEISQRIENGRRPLRRKNAEDAVSIIASAEFDEARVTLIQL